MPAPRDMPPALRAKLKAVLLALAFLAVALVAQVVGATVVAAVLGEGAPFTALALGGYAVAAPLILLATVVFVRVGERRPLAAIGAKMPRRPGRQAALAVLGATAALAAYAALAGAVGSIEIAGAATDLPPAAAAATTALVVAGFAVQSATEEWVIRGYLLRVLTDGLGFRAAAIATSLVFAAGHGLNAGATWLGAANTAAAGLLFALLVRVTGSLWAPAIAHAAWNVLASAVASLPLSGARFFRLLDVEVTGPELVTGGAYGPEASLAITVVLAAALAALVASEHRRRRRAGGRSRGMGIP